MDALFNNLNRGQRYMLRLGNELHLLEGVFHEYLPDGTLYFANEAGKFTVNPSWIVYAAAVVR